MWILNEKSVVAAEDAGGAFDSVALDHHAGLRRGATDACDDRLPPAG